MFDKVWDAHVVKSLDGKRDVIYIDRHYIHEVTSPQAFSALKQRGLRIRCPDRTIATADHNVPTVNQHLPIAEPLSRHQVATLTENCADFGVELFGLGHSKQGIVHVIGPELGLSLPGMTIVCGDSHTSTHGALGNIAFGIGTSQVEQVFATQCLILQRPKTMRITIDGKLQRGVSAKDIILHIIAELTTGGATGYFVEYAGQAIRSLTMEGRMTVCNMSIEMGARGGMIAPDDKTYTYLRDKEYVPREEAFDRAVDYWNTLCTDRNARFDKDIYFDASVIEPMVTFGTNPGMGIPISHPIPTSGHDHFRKSLDYMGFRPGEKLEGKKIQHIFIGSCTNSRIEDLRIVASFVKGKRKFRDIKAFIVPGSKNVEEQARKEGLHEIFDSAGFEFRQPGCSACLGMNEDKIPRGEYCMSTSNRNFEGRQGQGARTILASPLMAAAAAITGEITDVRKMMNHEEI